MIQSFLSFVASLITAANLSSAIEPNSKHLTEEERFEWSYYMVEAGRQYAVDPYFVAAHAWHESNWTNLDRNATNDYGVMQVHWQRLSTNEHWLDGLTTQDLMDPRTNIFAGVQELAHLRQFCASLRHSDHYWWAHSKWGVVVGSRAYDQAVFWQYLELRRRSREHQTGTPHRRGDADSRSNQPGARRPVS